MKLPLCLLLALCPFLPARQWTNQEGQTIEAEFQSLEDEQVSLLMNGKVISYPLAKLSPADQEFARNSQAEKEKARIVKTGSYARENISTRLFPSIEDYFKDRDREDIVKAFEAGKGWDEDRNGDRNSWLKRDEGTDHCSFYVPADFKLGEPGYGLLLVINPGDNATIPKSWHPVLDELKLIAVAAGHVGNKQAMMRRVNLSMDALATARERFGLDGSRQLVTGLSGGGHMAMLTAAMYPEEFIGALSHAAQSYLPGERGHGHFPGLDLRSFQDKSRKHLRWAVISGDKDQNYAEIKKTSSAWDDARLTYRFFDIPGMAHTYAAAAGFKEALTWLEATAPK